jgi:uncharacterized membrane protein
MIKYSTSITINADQEATWKVLSDVAHWPEWTPTVTKVEVLDQSKPRLDNRYKVYQPKLQPVTWTVTEFASPSGFTWESRMPGVLMIAEHVVKPIGAEQTETTLTFSFQGLLGAIVGRIYGRISKAYIDTEAQSLKKRVESSVSSR